jgi:predicted RNase H-like HicB family nuclease
MLFVLQGTDAQTYRVRKFLDMMLGTGWTARMMTPRYHINVFWSDEDGAWIADVPDLRDCSAHGRSPAEAAAEAQEAIALWLETARAEGIVIPEARYRPSSAA